MRYVRRFIKFILVTTGLWLWMRALVRATTAHYEPELKLLKYLVHKNKIAIDVGANDGLYTDALLGFTSRVIVVEPNPNYVKELQKLFGSRITLIAAALSDVEGSAELHIPIETAPSEGQATLERDNPITKTNCRRIRVPLKKLDSLGLDNVGFIKIDVEGHEEKVIAGGEELICRCHPILLVEVENRHRPDAVRSTVARMKGLGYAGFFLDDDVLMPVSTFNPSKHQPERAAIELLAGRVPSKPYCNNFIFLPTGP